MNCPATCALCKLLVLIGLCASTPAFAQDRSNFDAYRKEIEAKKCEKTEEPAITIYQCDAEMTFYYFTKSLHPAHPSVVERALKENKDGVYFSENGRSYGPDKTQPAFEAWLKEFKALDEEVRQDIAREQGKAPAKP